jgi:hypothetical protein
MNEQLRRLRATELKLLQDRTKLQRRIDEAIASTKWNGETVQELNKRLDQIEAELHRLRADMRALERSGAEA